jgi:hypothetical protein
MEGTVKKKIKKKENEYNKWYYHNVIKPLKESKRNYKRMKMKRTLDKLSQGTLQYLFLIYNDFISKRPMRKVTVKSKSKKSVNRLKNLMSNNPICIVEQDKGDGMMFLASGEPEILLLGKCKQRLSLGM